jgi:hypothetical protein
MIEVKEATQNAIEYFKSVYGKKFVNVDLDEVELSDDEKYWYITLGYERPMPPTLKNSWDSALGRPNPWSSEDRRYKLFKLDAASGKVLSMKVRKI